jgi:membrane-associated protein
MTRSTFTAYNVIGGFIWVVGLTLLGYAFGNVPLVQQHMSKVIWALIIIPGLLAIGGGWWKSRQASQAALSSSLKA